MDEDVTQIIHSTDVSALATAAKQDDIISELQSLEAGLITNNPWNGYGLYAFLDDGVTMYIMEQDTSGKWIITKVAKDTGVTTYSTGTTDASTNWTNRASLTYADYNSTF